MSDNEDNSDSNSNTILMFNEEGESSIQTQLTSPIVTEAYLTRLTNESNLSLVNSITISINSEVQSLQSLGSLLPNLVELRLINSFVSNLRDFGREFKGLKVLHAGECGLIDLESISTCFPLLETLNIPYNQCSQLSPLFECAHLTLLNLEGNKIFTFDQIEWISELSTLKQLVLTANPIVNNKFYRLIIGNILPQIEVLDGKKLSKEEKKVIKEEILEKYKYSDEFIIKSNSNEMENISYANVTAEQTEQFNKIKNIQIEEEQNNSNDNINTNSNNRPLTASSRALAIVSSALSSSNRPLTASSNRPQSALLSDSTSTSTTTDLTDFITDLDSSSNLTYGNGIIVGNFIRTRRKQSKSNSNEEKTLNNNRNINSNTNTPIAAVYRPTPPKAKK